ncbi:MAG: FkbM family methyltransferase [Cyanobacteriota bacterium]|nr:FkbM family methyltransferase [Cyanobacteriota bacterium]
MINLITELKRLGILDGLSFQVASVGARDMGEQDFSHLWYELGEQLTIYNFEPDEQECQKLAERFTRQGMTHQEIYIPKALGQRSGQEDFYITRNPGCSSLYLPDEDFLGRLSLSRSTSGKFERLKDLNEWTQFARVETVNCSTLDQEIGNHPIDFIKIDAQGAGLDILRGGEERVLNSLLAIQVEIEFVNLYHGESLFGEVDTFLRQRGFSLLLIDPSGQKLRSLTPLVYQRQPSPYFVGQLVWGDVIYYRDLIQTPDSHPNLPQSLLKLICVLYCLLPHRFIDICAEYIIYLITHYGDPQANHLFDLMPIIKDWFQSPDLGLQLSDAELGETKAWQQLSWAKELAQQISTLED